MLSQVRLPDSSYMRCLEDQVQKAEIRWGWGGELRTRFSSVRFGWSFMSNSLWPHELQHTRPPYPSPTPRVHPNPCPLSRWCHPTISSSVACLLLLPSIFSNIRVFSNESALRIRWPKYWSFSLSITPGTAACQASLSTTNSWSLLKLMSIELVMLFNGGKASVLQGERSSRDRW